jgi:hypothetical protein
VRKPSSFWQFPSLAPLRRARRGGPRPATRQLRCEQLEARNLLAADGWYNMENPADVNDDGSTSALDALVVANAIFASDGQSVILAAENADGYYLDVNNDGQVDMADFSAVVNEVGGGSGSDAGAGNAYQYGEPDNMSPVGSGSSSMMTSMSSSASSVAYYTVEVDSPTVGESGGNLVFTIKLNGDVPGGATIHYTTAVGSGAAATPASSFHVNNLTYLPKDYIQKQGQVVLSNDGDTATVNVVVLTDEWVELDETLKLVIDSVTNNSMPINGVSHYYDQGNSTTVGVGTITNDDAAVVSLAPAGVYFQANEGSGPPYFHRSFKGVMDNPVDTDVVLTLAVADGLLGPGAPGLSPTSGADYTIPPNQVVKITPGAVGGFSNDFEVNIVADYIIELDEQFTVWISAVDANGRNVTRAPVTADPPGSEPESSVVDTIKNDDAGTINLVAKWSATDAITTPDALEDQWTVISPISGLPSTIQFEVRLTHNDGDHVAVGIDVPATVNWQTVDGTAIIGGTGPGSADYTGGAGAISGSTRVFGTLPVGVVADTVAEPDQSFEVELIGAITYPPGVDDRAVSLGTTSLTAWIRGDDYATLKFGGGPTVIVEGNFGFKEEDVNVALVGTIDRAISVTVTPGPVPGMPAIDTATEGTLGDYILYSAPVHTFTPTGPGTQPATVRVYGDTTPEHDEYFQLLLGGLIDNGLAPFISIDNSADSVTVMIENDD